MRTELPPPAVDTAPAITAVGLTKRYGSRAAVDQLSLSVPRGVVAGFIGPNGAGKTTTMAMLLGLVRPSAGSGTVLGGDLRHPSAYLHRVGALIESPSFWPGLTGRQNLLLLARAIGERDSRVDEALALVSLTGRDRDRYRAYSLGMKQRLAIAATLLKQTEEAIQAKDQRRAAALAHQYGQKGHDARPLFALLLQYAVSQDGALHAEKYYRTVSEEFAMVRPAFRWQHLVALARVTASECGTPAPGVEEARKLLS